jgi:hypothetical protein
MIFYTKRGKKMEKTDRDLLKDALELKVQIRNLSSEEQKEILLNKISEIRECLQKISLAFEPYELSSRQKEVERLALIGDTSIVDTYWEIYDFIDDYGATKKGRVYIDEVEQLRKLLDNLEQKCKRD